MAAMRFFPLFRICILVLLVFFTTTVTVGHCDELKTIWINGSPNAVKRAVKNNGVNTPDSSGMTPLHHAAQHNSGEAVCVLLSLDAKVNARNNKERTPLMLAAMDNEKDGVILSLIAFGADRDARDDSGQTALMLAVEKKRPQAVLDLLQYGANPFIKDNVGRTAEDYLANNTEIANNEAGRQLRRYSDRKNDLYDPDRGLPQEKTPLCSPPPPVESPAKEQPQGNVTTTDLKESGTAGATTAELQTTAPASVPAVDSETTKTVKKKPNHEEENPPTPIAPLPTQHVSTDPKSDREVLNPPTLAGASKQAQIGALLLEKLSSLSFWAYIIGLGAILGILKKCTSIVWDLKNIFK